MFREFNVKFENVDMIGGSDNLLENTKVTKVIMRGDNKMSSLDSTFKNCKELDTIDGELELNGVSDIDNLLEGTELVKSINLKNVNNENISANNSFPHIEEINIGGELYNKKALQNVIASKEWTFDNINYVDAVGENVITKEVNIVDDNKIIMQDTLEQKAKGIEIFGNTVQGYANVLTPQVIIDHWKRTNWITNATIVNKYTINVSSYANSIYLENAVANDTSLAIQLNANTTYTLKIENPHLGSTSWIRGVNEDGSIVPLLSLEDKTGCMVEKFTTTSTGKITFGVRPDSDSSLKDMKVFCVEGDVDLNLYDFGEFDLEYIQSIGDLYVDEDGEAILDEEGNEQYKLEIISSDGNGKSNKTTILMPCTLKRIKGTLNGTDILDKLIFDENTKSYVIHKNINTYTTPAINYVGQMDIQLYLPGDMVASNSNVSNYPFIMEGAKVRGWSTGSSQGFAIKRYGNYTYVRLATTSSFTNEEISMFLSNKKIYYVTTSPQVIKTKILEKPSLETYSPTTYISTNSEVQPSQMSINNKETIFISKFLDSNKKYTIKFNCTKKGISPIKINLGGAVKEINPIIGENVIEIVTSSAIDKKELVLSGEGNIVEDVYIIADNMSTGELQEDGTYKIGISTTNQVEQFNLSFIATKPLEEGNKLYWSSVNKRYEIDRNGEIEIPAVVGDVVDLPRLYQGNDTFLTVNTGNINPSKIEVRYLDID